MSLRNFEPRWNDTLSKEYSDDTILWRYLSFDKFIKLFAQSGIYFRKLSKLDDPYEGVPIGKHFQKSLDTVLQYKRTETYPKQYLKSISDFRHRIYVNCWNQKENESYLLWNNYSQMDTGISIRTTYKKIKLFFNDFKEDIPLFFGKINYSDTLYNKSQWAIPFTKRPIYSEESEFRIIYQPNDNKLDGTIIKGDIKVIIDEIYLAPKMSNELSDLVTKLIVKNGLSSNIVSKSKLYPEIDPMNDWKI